MTQLRSRRTAILVSQYRAGSPDIFSMEFMGGKGSEPVGLASSRGNDLNPVFSPDGKQIAFSSNREGGVLPNFAGLYVMNADGSDPRRIVTGKLFDGSPAWSPDGKRLFFSSGVSFVPNRSGSTASARWRRSPGHTSQDITPLDVRLTRTARWRGRKRLAYPKSLMSPLFN
jgi:Tol biopolymer transport system component